MPLPNIVIIGGGVAGLTAAHELKERGFSVTVYERQAPQLGAAPPGNPVLGGKARSYPVPPEFAYGWDSSDNSSMLVGLPAEHGFRFFPSFYQHIIDTFRRIPTTSGKYVINNLIDIEHAAYAVEGKPFFRFGTHRPDTIRHFAKALESLFIGYPNLGLSPVEAAFAASKLLNAMTMCDERREAELDQVSWWDYMNAENMSDPYKAVVVNGLTQNFVAMDARYSSTKSVINILARLLNDLMTPGHKIDRILNGPTSEVWIDPWRQYLETVNSGQPAVQFHSGEVTSLIFDLITGRIQGVNLKNRGQVVDLTAHYILAVPVESASEILDNTAQITPEIFEHSPSLKLIKHLKVSWMTGVVYYLLNDVEMCPGHVVYLNSSWAITSISQNQFWTKKIGAYGQRRANGDISAIISDWDTPGTKIWQRPAKEARRPDQIARETLAQIRAHLTGLSKQNMSENDTKLSKACRELDDSNIAGYCLDLAIVFKNMLLGLMSADEFKSRLSSWHNLPEVTQLHNRIQELKAPAFARRFAERQETELRRLGVTHPVEQPFLDALRPEHLLIPLFDQLLGPVLRGPLSDRLQEWFLRPAVRRELEARLLALPTTEWPLFVANYFEATLLAKNETPLFINSISSWQARPAPSTGIENLFLASDYVKTSTDLATMEGANEAGRRAANGILDAEHSIRPQCKIFDFQEPAVLAPIRAVDKALFDRGIPHPGFIVNTVFSFGAKVAAQARKLAKG
jgi:uncharacterized protein with NAD-binding domain and iron-sulfur cluster